MGVVFSASCISKKKIRKKNNLENISNNFDIQNNIEHSAEIFNNSNRKNQFITNKIDLNQKLISNLLSNSEDNLLKEIRKEKVKRPQGIIFNKTIGKNSVIRMASWNLQSLTVHKLINPGVMTVICLTILENSISFIAFQEVVDENIAHMICKELNAPTLTPVKLHRNSYQWSFIYSEKPTGRMFQRNEYGMIIYDTSQNISILQTSQLGQDKKDQSFTRNPFLVNIKVDKTFFFIAVFHIKAKSFENTNSRTHNEIVDIALLAKALQESLKPGHKVIFMGDFNEGPNSESFQSLKDEQFMFCINDGTATNISKCSFKCYDNIWINYHCRSYYTGLSGVINEGLVHPLIPKAEMRGWGGNVSDHRPVWADFLISI